MEKELLKNHVREISKIIFGDLLLNTSVLVNEEKTQKFESKFMCEIELINEEINQNQINKLSKLINKKIHQSSNKIYWFEGGNSSLKEKSFMKPAEDLIKCVDLPVFLDNYIFKKLKAKYAPDHTKFNKNLKHDEVDVQTYLGTYFPRSFAETYSIFNNILLNDIVKKTTRKNKEINILDIGSGTGGNLSGLIISLIENLSKKINVNIIAIDGNKDALKILERIISKIQINYNINICLSCHYVTFDTVTDLHENSKQFFEPNFDFIISSKMINEIISKDKNSYFNYYKHFAKYLNDHGLLLMLDVTTKIEPHTFMPILLNLQTMKFIQENEGVYRTLLPTICSEYDYTCKQECFSNNHFTVNHSQKSMDKSKITYKVIGKGDFVLEILSKIKEKGNVIGWDKNGSEKNCGLISFKSNKQSAYKI